LPELLRTTNIDTLLVDPPRKGLEADTIAHLGSVRRMVYISCNPATQVRDVRALRDAGFELMVVQPFDMFPQTYHIENVMVLERAR
jgi:23S rRNA (uracil1939-C5)-methyltransferase